MHRGSIHQRHPKAPFTLMPCGINCYAVLAPVSKCYPPLMGRLPTCYSPVRHSSFQLSASTREERSVRLACIRHAASVHPEPGSNSHINMSCSNSSICCSSELTSQMLLLASVPKYQGPCTFKRNFVQFSKDDLVKRQL